MGDDSYFRLDFYEAYNNALAIFSASITPKNIRYSFEIVDNVNPTVGLTITKGTTANRPSNDFLSTFSQYIGFKYFDTTLGKPIFWNGSAWVDALGSVIS